jgi:hypothetical protein
MGSGGPIKGKMMKRLLTVLALVLMSACRLEPHVKADDQIGMECRFAKAWDFMRCENEEVICYSNKVGLSCTWK